MSNYHIDWQSANAHGIPRKEPIILPQKLLDSTSTSITLTGRGVNNYGEIQQENFIRLLENFASKTSPLNPTVGQLWFDGVTNVPYVFDMNEEWIPLIVGDTNGYITLAGDPTQPLHPVTKQYLDSIISGLLPQSPVVVATTANITLSGLQTIDGIVLVAGDRVLVKDQTNQVQNGVYVAASGAWTRAVDFDANPSGEVIFGMSYEVISGTINISKTFSVATANPIVINTSNIVFVELIDYVAYINKANGFTVSQNFNAGFTSTGASYMNGARLEKTIVLGAGSGTRTVDLSLGNVVTMTSTGNTTLAFSNAPVAPRAQTVEVEITNGGAFTFTWPASVNWLVGSAPALKSSGVDIIRLTTVDAGTTFYASSVASSPYTLPAATSSVLGGVKVGTNLAIDGSNVLAIATSPTITGSTYTDGRLIQKSNDRGNVSGAQTVDLSLGDVISCNIDGNTTFSFTNPATTGKISAFIFEITNGGAATITWPAAVSWVPGTAPTLRTGGGKNVVGFFTRNGGTTYQAFLIA